MTHSQKIITDREIQAITLNILSLLGYLAIITKEGKYYLVIVNGDIITYYHKRHSAKQYLKRFSKKSHSSLLRGCDELRIKMQIY